MFAWIVSATSPASSPFVNAAAASGSPASSAATYPSTAVAALGPPSERTAITTITSEDRRRARRPPCGSIAQAEAVPGACLALPFSIQKRPPVPSEGSGKGRNWHKDSRKRLYPRERCRFEGRPGEGPFARVARRAGVGVLAGVRGARRCGDRRRGRDRHDDRPLHDRQGLLRARVGRRRPDRPDGRRLHGDRAVPRRRRGVLHAGDRSRQVPLLRRVAGLPGPDDGRRRRTVATAPSAQTTWTVDGAGGAFTVVNEADLPGARGRQRRPGRLRPGRPSGDLHLRPCRGMRRLSRDLAQRHRRSQHEHSALRRGRGDHRRPHAHDGLRVPRRRTRTAASRGTSSAPRTRSRTARTTSRTAAPRCSRRDSVAIACHDTGGWPDFHGLAAVRAR